MLNKIIILWYKYVLQRNLYVEALYIAHEVIHSGAEDYVCLTLPRSLPYSSVTQQIKEDISASLEGCATVSWWLATKHDIWLDNVELRIYRKMWIQHMIEYYKENK